MRRQARYEAAIRASGFSQDQYDVRRCIARSWSAASAPTKDRTMHWDRPLHCYCCGLENVALDMHCIDEDDYDYPIVWCSRCEPDEEDELEHSIEPERDDEGILWSFGPR